MFWIGTIVGIVIGVVGFAVLSVRYASQLCGSFATACDIARLMETAHENRRSYIYAIKDDDDGSILDAVTFEER